MILPRVLHGRDSFTSEMLNLLVGIRVLAFVLVRGDVPTNVTYACPNLNCTVTWDPPVGTSDSGTVLYTIFYQEFSDWMHAPQKWIQKDECTNTSLTFCHLGADFDDVIGTWSVRVKAVREGDHDNDSFTEVSISPYFDATLEAAEITNISTTTRSIFLRWLSPHTPYIHSNGNRMRMTDYYTIFYNITYCIPFDPSSCVAVDTGSSEFVTINEKIIPSTTYEITLQGRILGYHDGDPVKVTVTTDKEGNKRIMTVVAVLVPLMALCFCTLYYCYKHRVFIREYCFRSTGKNDFSEHMVRQLYSM
ncbi:uncharacterized protein [Ptychodera flava]|uniref:uncharacterized protein n=1 Tax=Ptychodera flava TaxID=63121 RepID=UPI003969D143